MHSYGPSYPHKPSPREELQALCGRGVGRYLQRGFIASPWAATKLPRFYCVIHLPRPFGGRPRLRQFQVHHIPTMDLLEIFDNKSHGLSTEARTRLYGVFNMHSTTRGPAGWTHEKKMHIEMMCMGSRCYQIFTGVKSHMNSAALVPGGTAFTL